MPVSDLGRTGLCTCTAGCRRTLHTWQRTAGARNLACPEGGVRNRVGRCRRRPTGTPAPPRRPGAAASLLMRPSSSRRCRLLRRPLQSWWSGRRPSYRRRPPDCMLTQRGEGRRGGRGGRGVSWSTLCASGSICCLSWVAGSSTRARTYWAIVRLCDGNAGPDATLRTKLRDQT
jgi:hypothetical protein